MKVTNNETPAVVGRWKATAREPDASVLDQLSEADRSRLGRLPCQTLAYIHHPSFGSPETAEELFPESGASRAICNRYTSVDARLAAHRSPSEALLSADQERIAFLQYNFARYRISRILEEFSGRRLTACATRRVLRWQASAEETRAVIVEANIRLVPAMARRSGLTGIDHDELVSEGNLALLESVDYFDCNRGFRFSSYACQAICTALRRAAGNHYQYHSHFRAESDSSPARGRSLDRESQSERVDWAIDLQNAIDRNAAFLNNRELKILLARFGLCDKDGLLGDYPKTLEEVSGLIGVSKERVRQIQSRALAKLRQRFAPDILAA